MHRGIAASLKVWIAAARPRTLPAAVAPVIAGTALAWHDGHVQWLAAALCLWFALLVQIGTNFANDYYDFVNGADTAARVGPRRAVAAGLVTPARMRAVMYIVFAVAFVSGLSLIHWGGPWLLLVGIASIICGIAYTGGPWPLGYHGLGDVFVFIFFGLVAVGTTYFVQTRALTLDALLLAAAIGGLAANILMVNNYRDVATDAAAGKRTLVVRWGRGYARAQFATALVVAFALPVVLFIRGFGAWVALPLVLVPLALAHIRRLRTAQNAGELIALLGDTGKFLALYAILFAVALVASRAAPAL